MVFKQSLILHRPSPVSRGFYEQFSYQADALIHNFCNARGWAQRPQQMVKRSTDRQFANLASESMAATNACMTGAPQASQTTYWRQCSIRALQSIDNCAKAVVQIFKSMVPTSPDALTVY